MQPPKINDRKLLRMVDQGKTQVEVGKFFGVSKQAVNKRLKVLRGKTTKIVATKKIEQVVDQKIDAIGQLQKINSDANEILNLLMRWNRGDNAYGIGVESAFIIITIIRNNTVLV